MSTRRAATTPAVSVLMSCYNASRWVEEAIQSVLDQTFADFEFIIVDDGSSDDTASILDSYAKRDSRVVVVCKPNTGLGDSLNVGLSRVSGSWVARIDADDICELDRLKRQMAHVRADSSLVFIGTGLTLIDENGQPIAEHRYPGQHRALVTHLQQVRKFPPHSSAMFRTDAVRTLGGYRPRIRRAQDWDLWLRLSMVGRLGCLDAPLVRIRKHANQVSHEDAGRRQVIDSRISLTSYWIRTIGGTDPVSQDEECFAEFRAWMEMKLESHRLFALQAFGRHASAEYGAAGHLGAGMLGLLRLSLLEPSNAYRFLWTRLTGERLALTLAREWLDTRTEPRGRNGLSRSSHPAPKTDA